jgi:hypothetical protein
MPARRQAAAKAVRGFFQGFPLYRKTFGVSRRRSRCRAVKASNTSGVIGTTRVSPFFVFRSVNSRRRMSTSGHSSLSNSPFRGPTRYAILRKRSKWGAAVRWSEDHSSALAIRSRSFLGSGFSICEAGLSSTNLNRWLLATLNPLTSFSHTPQRSLGLCHPAD